MGLARRGVLCIALMVLATSARAETDFCAEWNRGQPAVQADLLFGQAQAFLTQLGEDRWISMRSCFKAQVASFVPYVGPACAVDEPTNFDAGMAMGTAIAEIFLSCGREDEQATAAQQPRKETFDSSSFRYRLSYDPRYWSRDLQIIEPNVELALQCSVCAPGATLTVGVVRDPLTTGLPAEKALALLNAELVTRNIRASPLISDLRVLAEGKTRLGDLPAYEVRMTFLQVGASRRYRHTWIAIDSGRFFNVSFNTHPSRYERDIERAREVIASFRAR